MAEVLGRYSKLEPVQKKALAARQAAETERRAEPWEAPDVSSARRVRQLLAGEMDAIVTAYQSGVGCTTLARKYGISEETMRVHLKAAGVVMRPVEKVTAEQVVEMAQLRQAGWTLQAIADRFGVTRVAVYHRLKS